MNLGSDSPKIEHMEKEFIRPGHRVTTDHPTQPLIVEISAALRNQERTAQQSCCLFSHRHQEISFVEHECGRDLAHEVLGLFTTIPKTTRFEKTPGRQQVMFALGGKVLPLEGIAMANLTQLR